MLMKFLQNPQTSVVDGGSQFQGRGILMVESCRGDGFCLGEEEEEDEEEADGPLISYVSLFDSSNPKVIQVGFGGRTTQKQ